MIETTERDGLLLVNPDKLEVGDCVYVEQRSYIMCKSYVMYKEIRIDRITPKRTKLIAEDGDEYKIGRTEFYAPSALIDQRNNLYRSVENLSGIIYKLGEIRYSKIETGDINELLELTEPLIEYLDSHDLVRSN